MLGVNEDFPLLALPHYKAKLVNNSPGPIPPVYLLQHHHAYQVSQGEALAMASWLLFLPLSFLSFPSLYIIGRDPSQQSRAVSSLDSL